MNRTTWKEIKARIRNIKDDADKLALATWFLRAIAEGEPVHPDKAALVAAALETEEA